jgi:hypothetical protein
MTNDLRFPPTVSPFFMNRESHENRESFGDANHSPLQLLTTICAEQSDPPKSPVGRELES